MQVPAAVSPRRRVLMGPGPSDVDDAVLSAMARPTLGHLDPDFLGIMDEIRAMLRAVFRTENELTMPMSGTGSAGMETCMANLLEPGDRALVGVNGVFGTRMAEVARRCGAEVVECKGEWGARSPRTSCAPPPATRASISSPSCTPRRAPACCSRSPRSAPSRTTSEPCCSSTASPPNAGHAVEIDGWGVDAAYSGTQKCLSCPPGLSPVTFSARAVEKMRARKAPVQSWYLDLSLIQGYWGEERSYHHTAPINMLYGIHEALRLILEEGLEARFERHARNAAALGRASRRSASRCACPPTSGSTPSPPSPSPTASTTAPPGVSSWSTTASRSAAGSAHEGQHLAHRPDGDGLHRAQRGALPRGPARGPRLISPQRGVGAFRFRGSFTPGSIV